MHLVHELPVAPPEVTSDAVGSQVTTGTWGQVCTAPTSAARNLFLQHGNSTAQPRVPCSSQLLVKQTSKAGGEPHRLRLRSEFLFRSSAAAK